MAAKNSQQIGWKFDGGAVRRSVDEDGGDGPTVDDDSFDGIIRREVRDIEVRAIDAEARTFEVVASTDSIDSHGDVVEQTFNLKRFRKNPVSLFAHNDFGWFDGSRPEDFLPVGHCRNVKVEDGKLIATIHVIKGTAEEEPFIDKMWRRIEQKALRAVSIGFRPGVVEKVEDTHKGTYFILKENELYEISIVPMGSNPDAVGKSAKAERQFLRRLAAKTSPESPEEYDEMSAEKLENAIQAKAEAEAKAKTLEADLAKAREDHQKALEAETAKVKALEEKNADLETKLETATDKSKDLSEKLEEKDAELKKFREAEEKVLEKAISEDVESALKAKYAPAKHDEKREKLLKIRKRSAEEFKEYVEDIPDLPELKSIVPEKGASEGSKSALSKAIAKSKED